MTITHGHIVINAEPIYSTYNKMRSLNFYLILNHLSQEHEIMTHSKKLNQAHGDTQEVFSLLS